MVYYEEAFHDIVNLEYTIDIWYITVYYNTLSRMPLCKPLI